MLIEIKTPKAGSMEYLNQKSSTLDCGAKVYHYRQKDDLKVETLIEKVVHKGKTRWFKFVEGE